MKIEEPQFLIFWKISRNHRIIRVIPKVTLSSSPSLWGLLPPSIPPLSVVNADTEHFNAQGSRPIIVVGQLGAVKICVAAVEVEELRKKERQDET